MIYIVEFFKFQLLANLSNKKKFKKISFMNRAFNKRINQFLFFVFKNNFPYTQLAFVFHLQEDHNIVHGLIDVFCFFLFQKNSYINYNHIDAL